MIVYLAGKYSGDIEANIDYARDLAIELWEEGYTVICPHLNTAHFETDCDLTYEEYLQGDFEIILRCDAVVMMPNWRDSAGATQEYEWAMRHSVPVYEYPTLPRITRTEKDKRNQVAAFMAQIMKMYRVHLTKNEDYSTANIQGPGEIGVIVRVWDKVTRLMNLSGFKVEVQSEYTGLPKNPNHEAVEDTFLDLAVYGIIGKLLRDGVWGK